MRRMETRALHALRTFAAEAPGYVGVSWGKDSVCVAHLAWRLDRELGGPRLPLVWVVNRPIVNPHCCAVRDAFLAAYDVDYHEVVEDMEYAPGHEMAFAYGWTVRGISGSLLVKGRFGSRHISGVRAAENSTRTLTMRRNGEVSANTCRPIGWWDDVDVFAYLAAHSLPVHPQYAMTYGGQLDRARLRVDTIGDCLGSGVGRSQHEEAYYSGAVHALRHTLRRAEDCPWWSPA